MTSVQRTFALPSVGRFLSSVRRWDKGRALLAALALAAFVMPRMPLPDIVGRVAYALLAVAAAAFCLRRGTYGSTRFRWGWRGTAVAAACCAVCASIEVVSPLAGGGLPYGQ